ncbi:MAG: phosphodiester glycosidase family protein [Muribaculaceae bacterium]
MKNKYFLILLFLSCTAFYSFAIKATTWDLQGIEYNVDTLSHAVIGPGTTSTALALTGPVKLRVFYTTTDMTNPNVNLKMIMGKDNLISNVKVPDMPASHSDKKNIYFAGVNADFIGGMGPVGTTFVNGEIYKSYKGTGWYAIGIDTNKKFYSGATFSTFSLNSPNAGRATIVAVNTPRSSNELILYTSRKGASTGTAKLGTEVGAVPVDGALKSDGATKMRVTIAPVKGVGNMAIPDGGFVLSANGFTEGVIAKMKVGEEFEITPTMYFNNVEIGGLVEIGGGCPMLLQGGKILNTQGELDHLKNREPRTAVGYSSDGTQAILLVVDGRQPGISVGVTSKDLAAIMLNLNCYDALNFDGGGSSTLYVKDLGVRNIPSEGSLRAVKNGLFVTTPATNDIAIAEIRFADYVGKIAYNSCYKPVIYGYNAQGVLVDTNVKAITLSCDSKYAKIQADGTSVLCDVATTFALTASLGNITTTIPVTVTEGAGVGAVTEDNGAIIYPNPIRMGEQAYIKLHNSAEISIYSANGNLINSFKTETKDNSLALPTQSLMSGIYLVSVIDSYSHKTIKLIIK